LTGRNQIEVGLRLLIRRIDKIVITIWPTRSQLLERVRAIGRRCSKRGQNPIADLIRERAEDDRLREEAPR
jgi:hypothetical protein